MRNFQITPPAIPVDALHADYLECTATCNCAEIRRERELRNMLAANPLDATALALATLKPVGV